ncbi:uncharacterized protein N0V89_006975 [Didymosphaeria variabile]|uniref:NAD(P)-binding protein n=1 Tax=Didymosphaeria variabile TaxID=1932322 RepID=A0A9W8XIS7_9PLEO|nr:uncharacterized protein N0V89_006975 [Didymosphaeria variabile]KAJ4351632.1 hypothetical protein N0V89_006975 [Didymosphaeria variabile]
MAPPRALDFTGDVAIVTGKPMNRFRNKTLISAFIGAGSRMDGEIGNGRATAILLARHGAKVALLDFNVDWAKETKRMIDEEGGISEVIQTDVTQEGSCKAAVAKTVELFGAVHVLVNIGGNPSLLYPTTKGAIIQMTRAMAAQHGQENIRVNCVCPGMVYTPMTRGRGMTDEMRQARINQNLMKKEGTGWDVGNGMFYICSLFSPTVTD